MLFSQICGIVERKHSTLSRPGKVFWPFLSFFLGNSRLGGFSGPDRKWIVKKLADSAQPRDFVIYIRSFSTGLRSTPRVSTSASTMSPAFKYTGGFRAWPIPGGVPVKIKSPGSNVKTIDAYATS